VGSTNSDDPVCVLNPSMDGLAVIAKALTAERHAQWLSQDSVARSEIRFIGHSMNVMLHANPYKPPKANILSRKNKTGNNTIPTGRAVRSPYASALLPLTKAAMVPTT